MNTAVITWIENWINQRNPGNKVIHDAQLDLYKSGLLDSLGIIELIEGLEDNYSIQFSDEDLRAGFKSIATLEKIVQQKLDQ